MTAGTILGFVILSAFVPEASARNGRTRPRLAGVIMVLVHSASAFAGPTSPQPAPTILGSAVAGILYGVSMPWLVDSFSRDRPHTDTSRRRALAWMGASIGGFIVGGSLLGSVVRRLMGPNTDVAIRAPDEPAPLPVRSPFPNIPNPSREITSPSAHYVVDIDIVDPVVEANDWSLSVGGLVEELLELSFADLQRRFTLVEEYSVLTCISNPVGGDLVGSSSWTGVRLGEVLSSAGLRDSAADVVFRCADGYSDSIPVLAAFDPSVILAIAQNGRPLTQEHGFPCRLRAPAIYGMKNAKWVEEIEVTGQDYLGYWEERGWSDVATVRTQSRIDTVGSEPMVGQPTWIAGVAWAGVRRVNRVEVSVDGGDCWLPARLNTPLSPIAWTQWAYRWTPPRSGTHRVLCRAIDGTGRIQDPTERPPHPDGASGYHEAVLSVI